MDPFAVPTWALACGFNERLRSLRRHGAGTCLPDRELAASRLERWRSRSGLDIDDRLWARRLAADNLGEEELLTLLGEPPEAVNQRLGGQLAWLDTLWRAYDAENAEPFPWPESATVARERAPFLPLVEPLVRLAYGQLVDDAWKLTERCPAAPFEPAEAADALLGHLPRGLSHLLGRALVVELHAARLEERLEGETPEERYQSFHRSLYCRSVALEILSAYPVLARQLVIHLEHWQRAGLEMLERLAMDVDEIRRRFADGALLDRLNAAEGGVSDPHRGGRGVVLLRFASGLRLVYKPRSLAVEAAFQQLLAWLNARGFTPSFRTLEILDRGDWGWMEYVTPAAAADIQALGRFFFHQGAFSALFQLLDGNDFHHENMIAAGEHPVPVDLETLFHPWVEGKTLKSTEAQPGEALAESPLRVGILPHRLWGTREQAGIDISGLGAKEGQLTPQAMLALSRHNTDEMCYERRRIEIPIADNRPTLDDGEVSWLDHTEDLQAGFVRLHRFVRRHRQALVADDGPLAKFADLEIRVLIRPTAFYGHLLNEACHPHMLSNALERRFLFDRLWCDVAKRPDMASMIPAELADFAVGDVPVFSGRPASCDLWTSSGERLVGIFGTSVLERVCRRIEGLDDAGLSRQWSAVQTALDVARLSDRPLERPSYPFRERPHQASSEELLNAAREVGKRLLDVAFESPLEALWLSVEHGEPEGWRIGLSGPDFYLGLPGISFFLGHLGAVTGDGRYIDAAQRALVAQSHQLAHDPNRVTGIGAWNGWGGLIYTATHLAALWHDPALLDSAEGYLERAAEVAESDELLDVIAGSAGLILALLALAPHRPSTLLGRTLHACGERLLAKAVAPSVGGLGWVMPLAGDRPLAGFSHGAAGIALALLRLTAATGDPRYRRAALEGIAYERALFDAEERNWPDLRADDTAVEQDDGVERFLCAWCHGAPGIGLARLAGLELLDDARVREELAVAVATTLEQGFGLNHCLCHGDLGNLDFLLEASLTLEDPVLRQRVGRLAGGIVDGIAAHGRLYGMPGSVETPGLMTGLSGIGYGLLRLADPERIPSLLVLEPPGNDRASRKVYPPLADTVLEPWVGGPGRATPSQPNV